MNLVKTSDATPSKSVCSNLPRGVVTTVINQPQNEDRGATTPGHLFGVVKLHLQSSEECLSSGWSSGQLAFQYTEGVPIITKWMWALVVLLLTPLPRPSRGNLIQGAGAQTEPRGT